MRTLSVLSVHEAPKITWPNGGPGFVPYELRIDGVPLLDLVRAVELPFAEREYDERTAAGDAGVGPRGSLAGDYLYLPSSLVFLPSRNLLGAPYDHGFSLAADDPRAGKSILLQCTCGVTECWFLLARIEVTEQHVTWSEFRQFYRDWTYDLGPFVFERAAYEAALAGPLTDKRS